MANGADVSAAQFHAFQCAAKQFRERAKVLMDEVLKLRLQADQLTGVANRYGMMPRLEQEQERVRRSGQPSSVTMMDLDQFKRINDSLGHSVGDRVLRHVARYVAANTRKYDQVSRYGG